MDPSFLHCHGPSSSEGALENEAASAGLATAQGVDDDGNNFG